VSSNPTPLDGVAVSGDVGWVGKITRGERKGGETAEKILAIVFLVISLGEGKSGGGRGGIIATLSFYG
jgi:hypothetical protein